MSNTYCVCCKQLSNDNHKDIFDENLLIKSQENNANEEFDKRMILRKAIELITGYAISKVNNAVLCEICFEKVECYIKFRSQLVTSFERSNNTQVSNINLSNSTSTKVTETLNTQTTDTGLEVLKEVTIVNNILINFDDSSSSGSEINDSSSYRNELPNFLFDISDSTSDFDNNSSVDTRYPKIEKSDIESDVNVCSGEDSDDVLELADHSKHNDTISSSLTESEDDYDYGPTVKKFKYSWF